MRARRQASPLRGLLLFLLGGLVGANATYFVMTRNAMPKQPVAAIISESGQAKAPSPIAGKPPPIKPGDTDSVQHDSGPILPPPVANMRGTPMAVEPALTTTTPVAPGNSLLIPVQGIAASQLSDTFTDARSAGRSHDAIDIMAPAGTPVLAVADGHVEKLFTSKLGGLTIYEFNRDGSLAYYYAHLQRYADGLSEQQAITRGQVIGYVGSTGNANPEAPHLHFAIFVLGPEKQWWKGEAVNPYPRLGGAPH
ncbi:M23 family metallopeptidase [Thermomonas sp.]|uniref:M23 family metallopeptidase n=1 Tax=Thermomonas sp. TaxID=1971895 RepID=UPI0024880E58|nr:M23 family metallopeptidase [Thermomonas sp.]MDI1252205.1 peptidoglycan DD-metalloendopeptidase family protein [Thermomonas sp.]